MKGCTFITARGCEPGFELAGFNQIVTDEDNIVRVFGDLVEREPPGLVFIDERLVSRAVLGRLKILEKKWGGAVSLVPAPGKGEQAGESDHGKRFVARVLGYQMKLG